jgi:hypothetical protein
VKDVGNDIPSQSVKRRMHDQNLSEIYGNQIFSSGGEGAGGGMIAGVGPGTIYSN